MRRFSPAFNHINDLMRAIQCAHRHIRNQHVRPLGGAQASADGHGTQIAGPRSISAPNTFSAYGSLPTMPMRMLRLRASSITFTPSVCPTPNYSVLTCHGHYDNYHSTFPA